jgi:hypothetical protein
MHQWRTLFINLFELDGVRGDYVIQQPVHVLLLECNPSSAQTCKLSK